MSDDTKKPTDTDINNDTNTDKKSEKDQSPSDSKSVEPFPLSAPADLADSKPVPTKSDPGKIDREKTNPDATLSDDTDSDDTDSDNINSDDTDLNNEVDRSSNSKDETNLFNAKPAPRMSHPQKRTTSSQWRGKALPIIAILLATIALFAVGWAVYHQTLFKQDWQKLESSVTQSLKNQSQTNDASLQQSTSSLKAASDNELQLTQQIQTIARLQEALTATQQRIKELSGRRNQDWKLAEVEYLIRLAEYKISLEKDKLSSIALLRTADEQIATIGDNSLLNLRKAIAKDIADLQLIVAPDVTGISVKLSALISQIPQLNIIALEFIPKVATTEIESEAGDGFSWKKLYRDFLDDFVTVKDHSEPVKPLMTMEQRGNLDANIQLVLQQAQIALVRGEQSLYELHLSKAMAWITEFFKSEEQTTALVEDLSALKQMQVNIDLPNQLSSEVAIKSLNQRRLYQWLNQNDDKTILNSPETQL